MAVVGGSVAAADVTINSTKQFAALDSSDGAADGCFHVSGSLIIANGGSINCNDTASPDACDICIEVTGDLEIQAGGAIYAENRSGGGSGGEITITVGGKLNLRGTSGPLAGAIISSSKLSGAGDTGAGGNITLKVTGDVGTEAGSQILADARGPAGNIAINGQIIDIDGLVSSTGITTAGQGGTIFIIGGCQLTISDTGKVSSRGQDPGADLVHLEACKVEILGLVESTGPGHQLNTPNMLDSGFRPDKPANSRAGVEVWAGLGLNLNGVPPHNGEVNVDTGMSGGISGIGWADLFATGDVTILNDAAGNYAVHANQTLSNGHGGLITVKSILGQVVTTGNALQANDTTPGGQGGKVLVEAGGAAPNGDVTFSSSSVQARGSNGGGGTQAGGTIAARSFLDCIEGAGGELNASGGGIKGSVTLKGCCATLNYSGVSTPPAVETPLQCGGSPGLQSYVLLPAGNCLVECLPPPGNCPVCEGLVVVDQNVNVDFNTNPPTYSGDPDLLPFFSFDNSGPTVDTWKAIFNLGPNKLLVKSGATISVSDIPLFGSNRKSPGISIFSTCEVEIEFGGAVVVSSLNELAGGIDIHADGKVTINGLVSDIGGGTNGRPGAITISSCCKNIETGPQSRIETIGTDKGGNDIRLLTCCPDADIKIFGLVDVFYKGSPHGNITVASFGGAVFIDGRTLQGIEPGTGRRITSGLTIRQGGGHTPEAGNIKIQALRDLTVIGNWTLSANVSQANFGAVAVKPNTTNGLGGNGDIIAVSLTGKIIAIDRAFDFDVRFDDQNAITLLAADDIELSVSAEKNTNAVNNAKVVVGVRGSSGGKGGTNTLRSFSGKVIIGDPADPNKVLVMATGPGGNGQNLLTSCQGVEKNGVVNPADANTADDSGVCAPAAPAPLFQGCSDFQVPDCNATCR